MGESITRTSASEHESPINPTLDQAELDMMASFHNGFVDFLRRSGYDNTYVIIANIQYNYSLEQSKSETPEAKIETERLYSSFMKDNAEQIAKTNQLRDLYAGYSGE